MARIKTYKLDDNVTGSDMWIGTDGNDASKTKNFSPTYLANYLNQNEVIDVSNSIRFTYDTIDSGKSRKSGTLSFATEIGAVVPINSITTFILSKNTQSTKLVNAFLNILPGTKIILQKSDYINIFGIFKVVSVTQIALEPDFYTVVVEYISGYGSLEEDKDYIISLIDLQGGSGDIPTKTSDLTNDGEDGVNPFITLEDLPPLPPNILSALPFTTDHLAITNNQYVIGDVVYYLGNIYKCLANNDSIIPTSTLYWENVGPGFLIVQQPIDWDSTSGNNQILNKPAIPSITGLVPYTGATQNVDLGVFEITAAKLIKDGGQPEQFLKADGSVDNNVYLTSADLPSTLDLYATTTASDIPTYGVLVRNIADGRFNTIAVDVTTPVIDGIAIACGSLITDPNIISGNPGVFNFTLSGNIRKISGPTASQAEFYFRIYKRVLAGTETLISESAKVLVPNNSGSYALFTTVALWNDGIFLDTDRIVLKFYGDLAGTGSGGTYQFQFGGISPVRGSAAIPTAVLPNIYLKDLADVENVDPLDKEILYWNDTDSLWEHSLTEDLIPNASATQKGLVSTGPQTIAGSKTFTSQPTIPANGGNLGQGAIIIDNGSGLLQVAYNGIYPSLTELETVKGVTSPIQSQIDAVNVNVITITTAVSIDTDTVSGIYGQHGRHNKISNGANAINIQCVSTSNADFVASYEKIGSGTITFTAGAGITLTALSGTAAMTGVAGSKACLSRNGSIYYLQITNY